jgi:hypothetical protein
VSGRSLEEEVALCLQYIDTLLSNGKMPAKSLVNLPFNRVYDAFEGFGYWVSEESRPHFNAICEHVEKALQLALEATYPNIATEILNKLKEDPDSLISTISITNSGQGALANIPILSHIPTDHFVDAWLSGPPNGWRKVRMALDNRYQFGKLQKELQDERAWLVDLKKEFDVRINASTGLAAFRLKRILPEVFDALQKSEQNG